MKPMRRDLNFIIWSIHAAAISQYASMAEIESFSTRAESLGDRSAVFQAASPGKLFEVKASGGGNVHVYGVTRRIRRRGLSTILYRWWHTLEPSTKLRRGAYSRPSGTSCTGPTGLHVRGNEVRIKVVLRCMLASTLRRFSGCVRAVLKRSCLVMTPVDQQNVVVEELDTGTTGRWFLYKSR